MQSFSTFLKCVCVEMKSIWKTTIFILFFFRTKPFLQEKKVFCQTFILFNQATERQNHFLPKMKSLAEEEKTFLLFSK